MVRCGRVLLALAIMVATSHSVSAQQQAATTPPVATPAPTQQDLLKPEQLEALVAPIALYPDALLANMLAAATYPLEVIEADRWVKENNKLKGDALEAGVSKKSWDDSVKALTATPSVLDMMSGKLDWTKSLGDAMLAQQADLMDAVQRLREMARANDKLSSNKQQRVTVLQQEGKQVITIEPTDPNSIYVPYYEPATVYGDWPYADYPPYYFGYPSYIGAGVIATGIAFGTAYAIGRWGNYWGGRFNWGNRNVYVNHRTANVWQHNPVHRQGVRYNNTNVQQRFGNNNVRAGASNRMDFRGKGGQQVLNPGANNRTASVGDRAGNAGDRAGDRVGDRGRDAAGNRSDRTSNRGNTGGANRANSADVRGNRGNAGSRAGQSGGANRAAAANRAGAAPARATPSKGGGLNVSSGRAASAASSRGRASFASMGGGGGGPRGGGGGARGGGGRRSDLALKHDVVLLGYLDDGLGYYRFSYNGSHKAYVGVIAQNVQALRPDAVTRGSDGYLRVDYEKLGLKFQSYRDWLASGAHIPAGSRGRP